MMCDPKALTASFAMNIFHLMLCAADVNGKGMIKNRQGKMYHWLSKDPPPHVWIDAAHKSTHNIYSHDAWWGFLLKYYICVLRLLYIFYQSFHCHDKKVEFNVASENMAIFFKFVPIQTRRSEICVCCEFETEC